MAQLLKGNYQLSIRHQGVATRKRKNSLTDKLEESALAKLGGSICFVMKKNTFIWNGDTSEEASR